MTGLLGGANYAMNQASYDLARLRVNGLITRIPGRNRYRLTDDGLRFAIFYTKVPQPGVAPTARRRPAASSTTDTKSVAHHRHSHHRNHRTGPPTAKGSLKTEDNPQSHSDQGALGTAAFFGPALQHVDQFAMLGADFRWIVIVECNV